MEQIKKLISGIDCEVKYKLGIGTKTNFV